MGVDADSPLHDWLSRLVARKGSDLLLLAGAPPAVIVDGRVHPLDGAPLEGTDIERLILPALTPHAQGRYRETRNADGACRLEGLGRFRVNLHRERSRAAAAIRALPSVLPTLSELGFGRPIDPLARLHHGLVLVGGPTGSGKTTTIAALVDAINRQEARHIVTIEDPIEYEHTHLRSLIEQVEVGVDAPSFHAALRAALRQAPDVIVVGEMRDLETMRIALAAAETGHLVFSTVHTTDVTSAVSRIADSFPPESQSAVRHELALGLAAVFTQTLVPRMDGGRVPAGELLMVGYGARQHIRKNALHHLHQEITITRKHGSFTLEESLADLVVRRQISRPDALSRAGHQEELEHTLQAMGA